MARPMGAVRRQFLASCTSMGRASAFDVAQATGLPRLAIERAASNALRSGHVLQAGFVRISGSDRPVSVYEPAPRRGEQASADARAWFVGLGELSR